MDQTQDRQAIVARAVAALAAMNKDELARLPLPPDVREALGLAPVPQPLGMTEYLQRHKQALSA